MIVNCPACHKNLRIPDNAAGKRVRCPACLEIISVAGSAGSASTSEPGPKHMSPGGSASGDRSGRSKPSAGSTKGAKPVQGNPSKNAARETTSNGDRQAANPNRDAQAQPESKLSASKRGKPVASGRRGSSRKAKEPDDDTDYESGYESSEPDPWGTPSWDEPNPYAVAPLPQSTTRSRGKSAGGGMRVGGIGLLIQAWGYVAIGVLLCLLVVFVFLSGLFLRTSSDARQLGVVVGGLSMLLFIPIGIAIFVGFVMCVFVPQKSGAQTPMIVVLGVSVIQVGCWVVQLVGTGIRSPALVLGFGIVRFLLGIAQVTFFCLFLKAAATWVRRDDLARTATVVMFGLTIGPVLGMLLMFVTGILSTAIHPVVGVITLIIAGIIGLATIGFWVVQVFLMFRLGTAMKNF